MTSHISFLGFVLMVELLYLRLGRVNSQAMMRIGVHIQQKPPLLSVGVLFEPEGHSRTLRREELTGPLLSYRADVARSRWIRNFVCREGRQRIVSSFK